MLKLKKIEKHKVAEDLQRCCRYCKNCVCSSYGEYTCLNNSSYTDARDSNVYKISEDGYLDETLRETLEGYSYTEHFEEVFEYLSSIKISNKKIAEFKSVFAKCMEEYQEGVREELDSDINTLYVNKVSDSETNFIIQDPESYVCEHWR